MSVSFPPTTMAEAEACERAAARVYADRIIALQAVLDGPEATAFEQAITDALAEGVPAFTSAATNLPSAASWFAQIRAGLAADLNKLERMAADPAAPPASPEAEPPVEPAT